MLSAAMMLASALLPEITSPDWNCVGEAAKFVELKEGRQSLKLVVAPGTPLAYQQIRAVAKLSPGSQPLVEAAVEVRTQSADDGSGGYLALEFVNDRLERVGIAHSQISLENGRAEWTRLAASMKAPKEAAFVNFNLVLHSHGSAWFANPQLSLADDPNSLPELSGVRKLEIDKRPVVESMIGLGFHCFHHTFAMSENDFELARSRWKELNPGFARINHQMSWTKEDLDRVARHMSVFQSTGAQIYVCTWDPPAAASSAEFAAYTKKVADDLDYLIRIKGIKAIRYYCMSNELSLNGWGRLLSDLNLFKRYHQHLFDEFTKRKLDIKLVATDASPAPNWGTIEWAQRNMKELSGAYGGHHYFNDFAPSDLAMAPWWERQIAPLVEESTRQKKPFIIGEFGPKQDGSTVNGVIQDRCIYFETPQEPMAGLQAAEAMIAGLRGGASAIAYWTFMDFPDDQTPGYSNKWGVFRNSKEGDRSKRAPYYSLGILTRSFRPGMSVFKVTTEDGRLRSVAALDKNRFVLAAVNRNSGAVDVELDLPLSGQATVSRYDPNDPSLQKSGPLPQADPLSVKGRRAKLSINPSEVVVLEVVKGKS